MLRRGWHDRRIHVQRLVEYRPLSDDRGILRAGVSPVSFRPMARKPSPPATQEDLETLKKEIFRYFDLKTEQLQHDFRGIFADRTVQHGDRIKDHERRILRAERKLGLVA